MKKRKIYLLQATTTPYRTELFNLLEEKSRNTDIDLTIMYYKKMMADRDWIADENLMTHKYTIYDCFEYFINNYPIYFSSKIIRDIQQNPDAEIILGVSWNDLIVMTIVMLKKLGIIKNKLHFWSEANYMAGGMKKKNKLRDIIRNFIFNSCDGKFIIPGKVAEITVRDYWKLRKEVIYLPNTINVDFERVESKEFVNDKINILIVARLQENIKGVLNFIKNIDHRDLKKCTIFVAGEGDDRKLYEKYIDDKSLENIHLIGNINREELLKHYKGCDLFVIPSFSDPNPLSIIEALFAGKPMLVSDQCGNKFEAIQEGGNGYLMNPYDPDDIREKFHLIINRYKEFDNMGQKSFEIGKIHFEPNHIAENFLRNL